MENPKVGVVNWHINLVSDCCTTFWILIPFVFSIAYNFDVFSESPFVPCITSTEIIELADKDAFNIPFSIFSPLSVLTTIIFGGVV